MKNNPTIGILAGMGPRSTAPFLDLVIDQCQKQYGARYDIDFPHILIYSLPTPFYVSQPIDDQAMELTISTGLKKLESTGVQFIAMPCNIAHKYFDTLKTTISVPLLNIVDSTVKKLGPSSKRVALFATQATIEAKIYQTYLTPHPITLLLEDEWQTTVNQLIQGVKAGEPQEVLESITKKLSMYLTEASIDTIIIACTDITKIVKTMTGFQIIDSSEALAEETVKTYLTYA